MLKVFSALLGVMLVFSNVAAAKYKAPEGIKSQGTKKSAYIFYNQDKDKDGKLTLEEYKNQVMTKDVEQHIRYLKKKGVYKTPEEEFKEMDEDGDGQISQEELARYYDRQSRELKEK